jgi:hypothetical protein
MARPTYDDVTVAILGGSYGLPTARLGDLIGTIRPDLDPLW